MDFVCPLLGILFIIALLLLGGWGYTIGRVPHACCATCKYPTAGLLSEICPECGGSLQGSGTRRSGDRDLLKPHISLVLVCRTLVVALPVFVAYVWAREQYPRMVSWASAEATSSSGAFRSVRVRGSGDAIASGTRYPFSIGVPRPHTHAWLEGPSRTVTLTVRDVRLGASYDGPTGRVRTADALTEDDVLAWMTASGAYASSAQTRTEARAVLALIRHVMCGGESLSMPGAGCFSGLAQVDVQADVMQTPSVPAMLAVFGTGLALWGLSVWPLRKGRTPKELRGDE